MDDEEFLHQLSVKANVNIELLKDLLQNEKFLKLIRSKKSIDATLFIRSIQPSLGLMEAKMIVEAFLAKPA